MHVNVCVRACVRAALFGMLVDRNAARPINPIASRLERHLPLLVVPDLIARLSDADSRVVRASADALSRITRQNHGVSRARWEAYWAKVQGR